MKIGSFVECIDDRFSAEQLKKTSFLGTANIDNYFNII